jgi:hypothetical protein
MTNLNLEFDLESLTENEAAAICLMQLIEFHTAIVERAGFYAIKETLDVQSEDGLADYVALATAFDKADDIIGIALAYAKKHMPKSISVKSEPEQEQA